MHFSQDYHTQPDVQNYQVDINEIVPERKVRSVTIHDKSKIPLNGGRKPKQYTLGFTNILIVDLITIGSLIKNKITKQKSEGNPEVHFELIESFKQSQLFFEKVWSKVKSKQSKKFVQTLCQPQGQLLFKSLVFVKNRIQQFYQPKKNKQSLQQQQPKCQTNIQTITSQLNQYEDNIYNDIII